MWWKGPFQSYYGATAIQTVNALNMVNTPVSQQHSSNVDKTVSAVDFPAIYPSTSGCMSHTDRSECMDSRDTKKSVLFWVIQ